MKRKYKIIFTREFLKKIKKLERETQIRIFKNIKMLEENPYLGKRLRGRLSGLFSYRIGDYRIIYQISESQIIIRTVGHRKSIYE